MKREAKRKAWEAKDALREARRSEAIRLGRDADILKKQGGLDVRAAAAREKQAALDVRAAARKAEGAHYFRATLGADIPVGGASGQPRRRTYRAENLKWLAAAKRPLAPPPTMSDVVAILDKAIDGDDEAMDVISRLSQMKRQYAEQNQ